MRAASLEAKQNEGFHREAASMEEHLLCQSEDTAMTLVLAWYTAGRVGDVLKLQKLDIDFRADPTSTAEAVPIQVLFRKGNGAAVLGSDSAPATIRATSRTLPPSYAESALATFHAFDGRGFPLALIPGHGSAARGRRDSERCGGGDPNSRVAGGASTTVRSFSGQYATGLDG